jgi:hypothetical protein
MPSKKQTRRSISVRGSTYWAVRADCEDRMSVSDYIEGLIDADRKARGLSRTAIGDIEKAVTVALRQADRQVERAVAAVRAIPSESKIVAGPPPEQTAMLGRTETPKRGDAMRQVDHAHAIAAIARRKAAAKAPPPIPAGRDVPTARPAHGDRVPPPQPGRSPGNVVSF